MEAYQERVIDERNDVSVRLAKLRTFLIGPMPRNLTHDEHARMWLQLGLMMGLERVLTERINAWAAAPAETGTHVAARDGEPERFIPHIAEQHRAEVVASASL